MTELSGVEQWWVDESDRLSPSGQDPVDDILEQQARAESARDRAGDHSPVLRVVAPEGVEQPTALKRREHRRRGWTRCDCGALEKGYRHPGHNMRCPRFSHHHEISDIR